MSEEELAAEWRRVSLNQICLPVRQYDPRQDGEGDFTYVDVTAIDNERNLIAEPKHLSKARAPGRARREIRAGDVLFSLVRPYLRKIARVPTELDGQIASTAFCVLRPSEEVETDWLFYAVLRQEFIQSVATYGHHSPSARDKEFLQLEIPVAPKRAQQEIIQEIEKQFTRLDAAVAALKRAKANLKHYRAAVLQAACEGELTNSSDPNSWERTTYGEITELITSGSRGWKSYLNRGSARFLLAGTVRDGWLDLKTAPTVQAPPGKEADRSRVRKNDILITIIGESGRVGRVKDDLDAYVSQSVALTRLKEPSSAPYLEIYLRSPAHGQSYFRQVEYGVGRGHLLLSHLRELPLVLPSLEEQWTILQEVERRLSVVEELERDVEANIRRAEMMRKAVLTRAFSGELVRSTA